MAIKRVTYIKEFLSKTSKYYPKHVVHHKAPIEYQTNADEDKKIREEIKKNFCYFQEKETGEHLGFDGIQQYQWQFNDPLNKSESEENKNYLSIIEITKAGALEDLEKISDLEKFVFGKGFRKKEN